MATRWKQVGVAAAVIALLAAGCSSDDDSDDGDETTAESAPDLSVLGEENEATGDPLEVGFLVDAGGGGGQINFEEFAVAAEATTEYVNTYLGGVGGRPLDLEVCETQGTAAGTVDCVNQQVQAGKKAILLSNLAFGESAANAAIEAGMPYVAWAGTTLPELTGQGVFSLTSGAINGALSPIPYMQDNGLENIAVLTVDVPAAMLPLETLARPSYEAANINFEIVPVPPGTGDMTANIAAVSNEPDMWLMAGDATFCEQALESLRVQDPDVPVFMAVPCVTEDLAAALPNGYENTIVAPATRLDDEDPETEVFEAIMANLSSVAEEYPLSDLQPGYIAILGFQRLMEGYSGDDSAQSIIDQIKSTTAPLPLGGSIEMTCGTPPVALLSAQCSSGAYLSELDAEGTATVLQQIDPGEYLVLG